jgi:hypothetical protein
MRGSVQDLVWKMWIEGKIKTMIGETEIDVPIPSDWQNLIDGELKPILSVKIKLKIKGLVARFQGQATKHALVDPTNNKLNKFRIDIKFDTDKKPIPIHPIFSEEELQNYLLNEQPKQVNLNIGRVMLPRVYFNYLYWPLSERAFKSYNQLVKKCYKAGRKPNPEEMKQIEGSDLRTIWEPPWEENPFLVEIRK